MNKKAKQSPVDLAVQLEVARSDAKIWEETAAESDAERQALEKSLRAANDTIFKEGRRNADLTRQLDECKAAKAEIAKQRDKAQEMLANERGEMDEQRDDWELKMQLLSARVGYEDKKDWGWPECIACVIVVSSVIIAGLCMLNKYLLQ